MWQGERGCPLARGRQHAKTGSTDRRRLLGVSLPSPYPVCPRRPSAQPHSPTRHTHTLLLPAAARPAPTRRHTPCPARAAQKTTPKQDQAVFKKDVAQLLGVKGAADTSDEPLWKIRLQLTKPVTWVPLIWGVLCGAAASGQFEWTPDNVAKSALCMVMSGPLLTGYTQTINDWYDRDIDAINEPYRPIPSGRITAPEVITQIWTLLIGGLVVAATLDAWAGHDQPILLGLAAFGSFISYIYSAPPLKLKQSGWAGNYALGSSYITLPWLAGQALFGTITADVVVLTMLYSIAGLGIAIVNDFKSIEGDRALGLRSLPVEFGVDVAKWITVGTIDVTQVRWMGFEGRERGGRKSGLHSQHKDTHPHPPTIHPSCVSPPTWPSAWMNPCTGRCCWA